MKRMNDPSQETNPSQEQVLNGASAKNWGRERRRPLRG